jgi:hypothetical protein
VVKIYQGAMEDMCECGHSNGIHARIDDHCLNNSEEWDACGCRKFKLKPKTEFDALVAYWLERL